MLKIKIRIDYKGRQYILMYLIIFNYLWYLIQA
jgi:hypothetical protein